MKEKKGWLRMNGGFTLIEIMIVVGIVAILAAIALPNYSNYVLRSKLPEAFSTLSDLRIKLEQYYQDNSRYTEAAAGTACPAGVPMPTGKYFTYTCSAVDTDNAQTYTLTATGKGSVSGFTYTVTNANIRATTATVWGDTSTVCWVANKGGECY